MPNELQEVYRKELHSALEKFQFIEATLRMCILSALEIARLELSEYFPLKYKDDDINKLSLGSLSLVFSKINDDFNLHKDLKNITRSRNHVAHQSLLFTLGEWQDRKHLEKAILEMKETVAKASDIHNRVLDVRYDLIKSQHLARKSSKKRT